MLGISIECGSINTFKRLNDFIYLQVLPEKVYKC